MQANIELSLLVHKGPGGFVLPGGSLSGIISSRGLVGSLSPLSTDRKGLTEPFPPETGCMDAETLQYPPNIDHPVQGAAASRGEWLVRLALAGLVLLVMVPLLVHGRFPTNVADTSRYVCLLKLFRQAVEHGVVFPRWLPTLGGGYGCPTFVFYQPLFFYLALPFSYLPGVRDTVAVYLAVAAAASVGVIALYRLGRVLGGRHGGLFAAALFVLTPYLYVNLYVRGDFSELTAMLLAPAAVYYAALLARQVAEGKRAAWAAAKLAVSLVLVLFAHPATAMFLWPSCLVLALTAAVGLERRFRVRCSIWVVSAFAWAALLGSSYWWPVLSLRGLVGLERATEGVFLASRNVVYPWQLFSRTWGFGAAQMSLQLGLPHFLLACAGVWLGRRQRFLWGALACYLLLIVMMLPVSRPVWDSVGLLRLVQFPWRILSVVATLQAVCCLGWACAGDRKGLGQRSLLAGLVLATALFHANQFRAGPEPAGWARQSFRQVDDWADTYLREITHEYQTFGGVHEFLPLRAKCSAISPLGDRALVELQPAGELRELAGNNPHRLRYQVVCRVPTKVLINQWYFPGWVVRINGCKVSAADLAASATPDGRMSLSFPVASDVRLEAYYGGPPGGRWRAFLLIAGTAVFFLGAWRLERGKPSGGES